MKIKEKHYGLMDGIGSAVKGTVDTARDVTGGAVSGVGSVLDSGGGKMVGGMAGGLASLGAFGGYTTAAGAGAGAAAGGALGATIGSIIPIAGTAAGGLIGAGLGGIAGGVGAAGLTYKAGQVLGSSATQATGEALKGVGNAIKSDRAKEFSETFSGSVLSERNFDDIGPDAGDAMNIGMTAGMGTGLKETSGFMGFGKVTGTTSALTKAGAGKMLAGGPGMVASSALSAPVDKVKDIASDHIQEAENYRPTVKNAFVKSKEFAAIDNVANTVQDGVTEAGKTVGNAAGGVAGSVLGGAGGALAGGLAGKAAVGASNKFLGTSLKGGGKWGMAAGAIGGTILGAQKGSSLFSEVEVKVDSGKFDRIVERSKGMKSLESGTIPSGSVITGDLEKITKEFSAVSSERTFAAGKVGMAEGLWNVAKKHKGSIAEGLGMGAVAAGTGYAVNRAMRKDREDPTGKSGMGAGKKAALTIGAGLAAAGGLKYGAKLGWLGKGAAKYGSEANKMAGKASTALGMGTAFGGAMAAAPLAMQAAQGGSEDGQGSGIGKKLLVGGALAGATALGGYKLAKAGKLNWVNKNLEGKAKGLSEQIHGKVGKVEEALANKKNANLGQWNADKKAAEAAQTAMDAEKKTLLEGATTKEARQALTGTRIKSTNPAVEDMYIDGSWKSDPLHKGLETASNFIGTGTRKSQKFANELMESGNDNLAKAGQFLKDHKKTALVATMPLGYASMMGAWDVGQKAVDAPLKKLDPQTYKDNENI